MFPSLMNRPCVFRYHIPSSSATIRSVELYCGMSAIMLARPRLFWLGRMLLMKSCAVGNATFAREKNDRALSLNCFTLCDLILLIPRCIIIFSYSGPISFLRRSHPFSSNLAPEWEITLPKIMVIYITQHGKIGRKIVISTRWSWRGIWGTKLSLSSLWFIPYRVWWV